MVGAGPVLTVEAVSKAFCRDAARAPRYALVDMLRDALPLPLARARAGLREGEAWSIEDVSFAVAPGEAVAVTGPNGVGKTTLLRIIAGLLKPDRGAVRRHGTVSTVIELGQGLNPILTGRENAVLGLAWRGLGRGGDGAEARRAVAGIEAFADLGAMFDAPVGTYSSGMRVRLAFAILAAIEADLLLLDEVMAVGDAAFRRKCIDHLRGHLARGGALIFVSHDADQMKQLCTRGLLLEDARLVFDGPLEQCLTRLESQALTTDAAPRALQG